MASNRAFRRTRIPLLALLVFCAHGLGAPAAHAGKARKKKHKPGSVRYLPSLSGALASHRGDGLYGHFWVGLTREYRSIASRYLAAGLEIDVHGAPDNVEAGAGPNADRGRVELWPVVRLGMSLGDPRDPIPVARLYTLFGARPAIDSDYHFRIGGGLSLPALLPLAEAGIPNLLEVTLDAGPTRRRAGVRVGWNF